MRAHLVKLAACRCSLGQQYGLEGEASSQALGHAVGLQLQLPGGLQHHCYGAGALCMMLGAAGQGWQQVGQRLTGACTMRGP